MAAPHTLELSGARFSRVCTVQESLLAQEVCFQLGHLEILAAWFEKAINHMYDRHPELQNTQNVEVLNTLARSMSFLSEYLTRTRTRINCFLGLACRRLCGNDRDRIYGMLGLVEGPGINPGYALSSTQVFADFVTKCLTSSEFWILHACRISSSNFRLPSYVPPSGPSRPRRFLVIIPPSGIPDTEPMFCAGTDLPPRIFVTKNKGSPSTVFR